MANHQVQLKDLWNAQQSILDAIHQVCTENGLRYSLAYGTLIGAVRHEGFIPWDDDVDIMMPREDYDRMIEIWDTVSPDGYVLETEQMHDDCVNNFLKVRKDHTTFLQFETERTETHHKGIYVDVFPGDRRAPGRICPYIQYVAFAVNLLFNRGYTSGTGGMIGFAEKALLKMVPKKHYRRLSNAAGEFSRRWNHHTKNGLIFPCTIADCRKIYSADIFDHLRPMRFNGKDYCAFEDYDTVLRIEYGDYMQLPPEEERIWKHHPIIIDFTHNYEELELEE